MIKYLSILLILYSCSEKQDDKNDFFGQTNSKANPLIKLNKSDLINIQFIADSSKVNYWDSINYIVDTIVNTINNENVDISEFNSLEKNSTFKKIIKIYSYNVNSDGTRGKIHWPILQWENENTRKAVNISDYIFCDFFNIIELNQKEKIYLMLGKERAYSGCFGQIAYVIKICGDNVNLEYTAFGGRPYLWLCNGSFSFDDHTLNYKLNPLDLQENLEESLRDTSIYKQFTTETSSVKILNAIVDEYYNNKSFQLTFDGSVFIKP